MDGPFRCPRSPGNIHHLLHRFVCVEIVTDFMSGRTTAIFILSSGREIPTSLLLLLKLRMHLKKCWNSKDSRRYRGGFSHPRVIFGETVKMVPDELVDRMVTNRNVGYPRDNKNNKKIL